ncbi:MAG: RlmF-related methyltransferase [Desulfobacterales bacterium]|nr:RlmF-related methyltransferase [Desulfobacterales bacterium]
MPGRADYIHYAADLLAKSNNNNLPRGKRVNVLDVGTGANCIYPIIGSHAYGWKFVGTDIDPVSVKTAKLIVESNSTLAKQIRIIKQNNKQSILKGIIDKKELFDLTLCNPPFHSSPREAQEANLRKLRKLNKGENIENKVKLNFGCNSNELWCPGGELQISGVFLRKETWTSSKGFMDFDWIALIMPWAREFLTSRLFRSSKGSKFISIFPLIKKIKQSLQ